MTVLFGVTDDTVHSLRPTPFRHHHVEADIQRWSDQNPELLNLGQPMLSLGCEIETNLKFYVDNMFLDGNGDLVVAELKRGKSPRDVAAQVIDYGAFVHKLSWNELDKYAQRRHGKPLTDAYVERFGRPLSQNAPIRHRLLIVAEYFDGAVLASSAYLVSQGLPLALIEFNHFVVGSERLLETRVVMGEIPVQSLEPQSSRKSPTSGAENNSGKNEWLIIRLEQNLLEIIGDLEFKPGQNSISFLPNNFGFKFREWRFRIDFYARNASVGFYYRPDHRPNLTAAIKQKLFQLGSSEKYRQSESLAYPGIFFSHPLPDTGDENAVAALAAEARELVSLITAVLEEVK